MDKLIIKAPVNSLNSAKMQITAGADEIYLSYLSDDIKNLSFSGRGKQSFNKINTQMKYIEFKKIIEYAHEKNVRVDLAANVPMSGNDPDGERTFKTKYLNYIKEAIDAGIDDIIVGDLGNLLMLSKLNLGVDITAGVFFATQNIPFVNMLHDLGVYKVCLPHHFTIDEVKEIIQNTNMKIEIFAHFGCSFVESTCSLYHHASEEIDFGIPCRACYKVKDTKEERNILDMGEDCAVCQMKEIIDSGVSSVKIIGRELDYKLTSTITYVYRFVIDHLYNDERIEDILKQLYTLIDFDFWKRNFCDAERCKYKNTSYYI